MAETTGQPEELTAKKLRYSEPDLKVTVKSDDDNGDPVEKEYQLYAQVLARQSKFVDTCLSVSMKEKTTKEIVFQDVTSDIFERALKFLDDPMEALNMTTDDALRVAEFYDKYEFSDGIRVCDSLISKEIARFVVGIPEQNNLDLLVDCVAIADKCHLQTSMAGATSFVKSVLNEVGLLQCFSIGKPFTCQLLSLAHLKKLHGLLIKHHAKLRFDDDENLTEEEVKSPLFPKYFQKHVAFLEAKMKCPMIEVRGAAFDCANQSYDYVNGEFIYWIDDEERERFCKCLLTQKSNHCGNWQLEMKIYRFGDDDYRYPQHREPDEEHLLRSHILATCPNSRDHWLPSTRKGWVYHDVIEEDAIGVEADGRLELIYHTKIPGPGESE